MEECINEYKIERRIRFNDNNRLFLCTKKETKEKYIIKRLENEKSFEKFINNSISIQKSLHHRNISKLLDYKIGERYTYLIFEYNKYSLNLDNYLQRYIRKYGKPLPQKIVQYIMTKIISAFMYLHEKNIMHRNLKPENILIIFHSQEAKEKLYIENSEIKICNFLFSCGIKKGDLETDILGTPLYMDPQLIEEFLEQKKKNNFGYDLRVDIWSLGIIAYELLYGENPFKAYNIERIYNKIKYGIYLLPYQISLSKEAIAFLNGTLQFYPENRLNIEQLSRHFFVTKNSDDFCSISFRYIRKKIYLSCYDNYLLFSYPFNNKYFAKLADINPFEYLDNDSFSNYDGYFKNKRGKIFSLKNKKENKDKENKEHKILLIDDLLEF